MSKLVSVIIPCFNAQRWIAEAIDSCLQQTYPNIEVIVIDDGSTDNSLKIIKSYGDRIIWKTGPNRGGNHARNKGFSLAKGDYIQYLDADDYLLPEKIERQVRCLEETGADVVYGDWRHKHHQPDGTAFFDDIQVSGPKEDFLESLLSNENWVAPCAVLFTKAAVERCGVWDETLQVGQDRDFLISVAMNGEKFVYQSGCYSIYRRYGQVTVSTSCKLRWLENHGLILRKVEQKLSQEGRFSEKYRQALAKSYYAMAREYLYKVDSIGYLNYLRLLEKSLTLFPEFRASNGAVYNLLQQVFGFKKAERIAYLMKQTPRLLAPKNSEMKQSIASSVINSNN